MQSPREKNRRISAEFQNDAEQSRNDSSNWDLILPYDVLRIIFKYLNARDLSSATLVCKFWAEATIPEYSTRGLCYIFEETFPEVSFLSKLYRIPYPIEDLPIKPCLGFIFVFNPKHNITPDICYKYHKYPSDYKLVILSTSGILKDKFEYYSYHNILFSFLPHIREVHIRTIEIINGIFCQPTKCLQQTILQPSTVIHNVSTCCIILCTSHAYFSVHYMFQVLYKCHKHFSSVWGGIIENVTYVKNHKWQNIQGITIVISGAIKTWSITIDSKCNTKELIKKKLTSFKEQIELKRHTIGFTFTNKCTETKLDTKLNIESTIFKELFPKVPLMGCVGTGIFEKCTVDDLKTENQEEQTNNSKIRDAIKLSKNLTTSFMILSYD